VTSTTTSDVRPEIFRLASIMTALVRFDSQSWMAMITSFLLIGWTSFSTVSDVFGMSNVEHPARKIIGTSFFMILPYCFIGSLFAQYLERSAF